jgi:hypothetical protein
VKFHFKLDAVECRPGFYLVEGGGGPDPDPATNVANAVFSALGSDPLDGFSDHCSLTAIEVQDVQPATRASLVAPYGTPKVGTVADDNPPSPQNSMLVHYQSNLKRGKGVFAQAGRIYVPGIYSTGQISGFLVTGLFDALSAFQSLLYVPFVTDGTAYAMACVAFNAGSPRTVKALNLVVSMVPENQTAIIRSRRPGRGI